MIMPLPRPIPRPSTLPLPRQVAELVPPPSVPTELATPSPTRPRPTSFSFKSNNNSNKAQASKTAGTSTVVRKVSSKSTTDQDTSDDGRGSSVSPTLQPKLRPMIGRTKSQPKSSGPGHHGHLGSPQQKGEQKFVRSLNQHIQQSSLLYQQSGITTMNHLQLKLQSIDCPNLK